MGAAPVYHCNGGGSTDNYYSPILSPVWDSNPWSFPWKGNDLTACPTGEIKMILLILFVWQRYVIYSFITNFFFNFFFSFLNKSVLMLVLTKFTFPDLKVPDKTSLIIHCFYLFIWWTHLGLKPRTPECKSGVIVIFTNGPFSPL